jgi:hypothetical protein
VSSDGRGSYSRGPAHVSHDPNSIKPSIDERMDIDTSFIDAWRTSGSGGLKKAQARVLQPDPGEPGKDAHPESEAMPDGVGHEGAAALGGRSGSSGATGTPAPAPAGVQHQTERHRQPVRRTTTRRMYLPRPSTGRMCPLPRHRSGSPIPIVRQCKTTPRGTKPARAEALRIPPHSPSPDSGLWA